MIKKLLFTLAVVLVSNAMFAKPVSVTAAKTIAINYYKHYAKNAGNDYSVLNELEDKNGSVTSFYIFNFTAGGFVMVAGDDAIIPVLGFSSEGVFDLNNVPVSERAFLDSYKTEISQILDAGVSGYETRKEWNKIASENFEKSTNAVSPLLLIGTTQITWDQGSPYNAQCPSGTPTGCVATSTSMIMRKWAWPATGTGSHSYTHATYGVQSANFGATTYNWAAMPANVTSANASVATLLRHVGVAVNMNYAPAGSGAYTQAIPPALVDYFSYQPSCEVKSRGSFLSDASWMTLIKEELNAGRPVLLAGNDATGADGHEWVCDGYNGANLFHMNWGWGGSSNAYFSLTALNPSGSNFSSNRTAVIRITPLNALMPIANFSIASGGTLIPAVGAPVDFTDLSVNNPTSWLWTFEGGTPATSTAQNPTGVTFATNGYHLISLKVTNATGSDIKTKERYIKVGGATTVWTMQNSGFTTASRGIDQINIVDANTVWAKAYDGTNPVAYIREFTRTNDGGTTWNPGTISFTNSANYGVSNIFAFDYQTAYACMFPITGTGGAIVKTTDGGVTWNTQPTATFTNSWADFVHFFDANNGVCVGDPVATTGTDFFVYTTSNGGATWTQIANSAIPNCQTGEAGIVNYYDAVGNTIWFTTNLGRCYKSTNMGATWTVASTGLTDAFTIKFKDANVGIAMEQASPYALMKTNNGGTTWQALTPTGYFVKSADLAFVPGSSNTWVDVASFPSNGSSISYDDGATFQNVDSGSVRFTSVAFFDMNTGWAGSFNASATSDGIYKWNSSITTSVNNNTEGSVSVYPVPSKGIVNISLGKMTDENMTISVYNVLGAKMMYKQMSAVTNDIVQLDLTDKEAGLYFITINNGGKTTTKKIQIQK